MSLFDEIRAGKALKKVPEAEKKDRSTLDGMKKVAAAPAASEPPRSGTSTPSAPMGMGGLFANGVPTLRPGGSRAAGPNAAGAKLTPAPPQPAFQPPPPPAASVVRAPAPRSTGPAPPPAPPRGSAGPPPPPAPPSSGGPMPSSKPTMAAPSFRPPPPAVNNPAPMMQQNGSALGRPMLRQRMGEPAAPKPRAPPVPPATGAAPFRMAPPPRAPPPPPAPPVTDRRDSTANRSQRVGLPSNSEDSAPRSANAKPKVIHINSRQSMSSGAPGQQPPAPPPPPGSNAMFTGPPPQRTHPPAPPPPPAQADSSGQSGANLAMEFERRFRFVNEQQLPAPPLPYHGQRTYKSKQNRAVPHPPMNAPNGPSYP